MTSAIPSEAPGGDGTAEASSGLDQFVDEVLRRAEPLGQNTRSHNIGFGWIYYGLVRNIRPSLVVAIGSKHGFMPFCAARAVKDNRLGKVIFIDPSFSGFGDPGWDGAGLWSDAEQVARHIASFKLTGWIEHLKMTSEEAFPRVREMAGEASSGVVIIDGAHTFRNSLQDFELYGSLIRQGYVLLHDAMSPDCGVPQTIATLRARGYPIVTLPQDAGLAIVEISGPTGKEASWEYLRRISNRGPRLLKYAQEIIRPGDSVMDMYCGFSPLGALLNEVRLFGYDRDEQIIQGLRESVPQHRWDQIEELRIFQASLPAHVDVLIGLGVSRGHAVWDPQYVLENARYLLGRYCPRACLFETAADYHQADILDDLRFQLRRLGYRCREEMIETNMQSYPRRKLLIAVHSRF